MTDQQARAAFLARLDGVYPGRRDFDEEELISALKGYLDRTQRIAEAHREGDLDTSELSSGAGHVAAAEQIVEYTPGEATAAFKLMAKSAEMIAARASRLSYSTRGLLDHAFEVFTRAIIGFQPGRPFLPYLKSWLDGALKRVALRNGLKVDLAPTSKEGTQQDWMEARPEEDAPLTDLLVSTAGVEKWPGELPLSERGEKLWQGFLSPAAPEPETEQQRYARHVAEDRARAYDIRRRYAETEDSYRAISEDYDLSRTGVGRIVRGESYADAPFPEQYKTNSSLPDPPQEASFR